MNVHICSLVFLRKTMLYVVVIGTDWWNIQERTQVLDGNGFAHLLTCFSAQKSDEKWELNYLFQTISKWKTAWPADSAWTMPSVVIHIKFLPEYNSTLGKGLKNWIEHGAWPCKSLGFEGVPPKAGFPLKTCNVLSKSKGHHGQNGSVILTSAAQCWSSCTSSLG